ncbi:response regulator [Pedobacter mucosus]|uniref:response regulator n=1 Tax=Pedobacter mucosus TaxID=2895286 RepID=UPI001EE4E634|nr:response regulator [Pedobacter mucosus]UKT64912.1 response regulator [Pedobacter mucosus]
MLNTDIFFVEDDTDFAYIMETAVQELTEPTSLQIIDNGKEAISILHQLAEIKQKPKLILLDLNLPGISGIEILKEIRDNIYLRYVPVVLFSTSAEPKDIKLSLQFGANAYVTKPSSYLDLIICLQSFSDFWLHQNACLN